MKNQGALTHIPTSTEIVGLLFRGRPPKRDPQSVDTATGGHHSRPEGRFGSLCWGLAALDALPGEPVAQKYGLLKTNMVYFGV